MKTLLLLLLLMSLSLTARASADGPDCWDVKGVKAGDVLNIRDRPNAKAAVLGKVPPNAKSLTNASDVECPDAPTPNMPKECASGWCRVTYKGVTGWVNCKFLEEGDACE